MDGDDGADGADDEDDDEDDDGADGDAAEEKIFVSNSRTRSSGRELYRTKNPVYGSSRLASSRRRAGVGVLVARLHWSHCGLSGQYGD